MPDTTPEPEFIPEPESIPGPESIPETEASPERRFPAEPESDPRIEEGPFTPDVYDGQHAICVGCVEPFRR